MYNVNTNVIFYDFWSNVVAIKRIKSSFTYIFKEFCLGFKNTVFYNPSQWLLPNSLPDIPNPFA